MFFTEDLQNFCLKKLFFFPAEKTADVGAVGIKDKKHQEEAYGKKGGEKSGVAGGQKADQRKREGGGQRGDGNNMAYREDEDPEDERDSGGKRSRSQENAERSRDTFSSLEGKPGGKSMAKNGGNPKPERPGGFLEGRNQDRRKNHRDCPFEGIQKKSKNPPFFSHHPEDIGGAYIFTSVFPKVDSLDGARDQESERNRTRKIGYKNEKEFDHDLYSFQFPHRVNRKGSNRQRRGDIA